MPRQTEAAQQRVMLSAPKLNARALTNIQRLTTSTLQLGAHISQDPFLQRRETLVSLIENQVTAMEVDADWHYLQVAQDLPIPQTDANRTDTVDEVLSELRQRTYGYASFAAVHRLHQQTVDLLRMRLRQRGEDEGHHEGNEGDDDVDADNSDGSSGGDNSDNRGSGAHTDWEDADDQGGPWPGKISGSTTLAPDAGRGCNDHGAASHQLAISQIMAGSDAGVQVQHQCTNGISGTNMGGKLQGGQQALD